MVTTSGRLTATAGNDAHANVGLSLNDSTGKTILGIKLDPFERSFHLVRMHVLLPGNLPLDSETLLSALRDGHCFIAFDLFGDTTGFRFSATNEAEQRIQGDQINLGNGVRLAVSTPVSSRIVLIENGNVIGEQSERRVRSSPSPRRGSIVSRFICRNYQDLWQAAMDHFESDYKVGR
jgi:hypothetical protein